MDEHDDSSAVEPENPYQPGDAAIDPMREPGEAPDEHETISPGRPTRPSLSRAYANFKVLMSRSLGKVGVAWIALGFVYAVTLVTWVYFAGEPGFAPAPGSDNDPSTVATVGITLVGWTFACIFIGFTRPLREIGFRGEGSIPGIGAVFSRAFERFFAIAGLILLTFALVVLPSSGLAWLLEAADAPALAGIVSVPVVLILYFLISPMFYIVPASNLSLSDALAESWRVVRDFPGYLVLSYLILIGVGLSMGCLFFGMMIVPIVGWICGFFSMIFVYFATWIAYAAIFATVDEVRGGFDGDDR